jgi:hypothetical protein
VVEISPAGRTVATFGTPVTGANGTAIPFDEPAGVSYLGTELVVSNLSYLAGDTSHMALFGIGTGELGAPVYVPRVAGGVAVPKRPAAKKKHRRKHRSHRRKHR